ncbi:MAG TPA: transglutaminase domain-containing protein [Planctomycetota bacterium]
MTRPGAWQRLGEHALDRRIVAALAATTAAAALTALPAMVAAARAQSRTTLWISAALLLLAGPAGYARRMSGSRRPPEHRLQIDRMFALLIAAGFLTVASGGFFWVVLACTLLAQGLLLARTREAQSGRMIVLAALLQGAFATSVGGGPLEWLMLAATLAAGLVALIWVEARASRDRIVRRSLVCVPGRFGMRRAVLALVCATLLLSSALFGTWAQRKLVPPRKARLDSASLEALVADGAAAAPEAAGPDDDGTADGPPRVFPTQLRFGRSLQTPRSDRVITVYADPKSAPPRFGPDRPLHLKAGTLDRFQVDGMAATGRAAQLLRDADDGRDDGWIVRDRPRADEDLVDLRIRQLALRLPDSETVALFLPEPVLAVQAEQLLLRPGGGFARESVPAESLSYRVVTRPARADRAATAVADPGTDPRWLQLPVRAPHAARLAAAAARVRAQAASPQDLVRAVVRHFAAYEYSLNVPPTPGIEGLADFLDARSGYCSYFAAAATWFLRSGGVPCRVAIGYRVSRWSEAENAWFATAANAHAWVELLLPDGSWEALEVTPGRRLESAIAAAEAASGADSVASTGEAPAAAPTQSGAAALESGGAAQPLWKQDGTLLGIAALAALAALLLARFARSGGPAAEGHDPRSAADAAPAARLEFDAWHRLLRALAKLGLPKSRSATPREYASALAAHPALPLAALPEFAEDLYRRRFGHQDGDPAVAAALATLAARIEAHK